MLLKGPRPEHLRTLLAVGVVDHLAHERHLFDNLDDAVAHAPPRPLRSPQSRDPDTGRRRLASSRLTAWRQPWAATGRAAVLR